jgi:DNA-directed RNA polymerase subunit RPC12/RpoP
MWKITVFLVLLIGLLFAFNYDGTWVELAPANSWAINYSPAASGIFGTGGWFGLGDGCFLTSIGYENITANTDKANPDFFIPQQGRALMPGNTNWLGLRFKFCVPSQFLASYPIFMAMGRMEFGERRSYGGANIGIGVGIPVMDRTSVEPVIVFNTFDDVNSIGLQVGFTIGLGGLGPKSPKSGYFKNFNKNDTATSARNQSATLTCPYCGAKIEKDYLYCPNCGHKLNPQK